MDRNAIFFAVHSTKFLSWASKVGAARGYGSGKEHFWED